MLQVNCYLPIKLRIVGELSDDQLEQLGQTLTRAVAARLEQAQRTLSEHGYAPSDETVVWAREHVDEARLYNGRYALPSYDEGGDEVRVPVINPALSSADDETETTPAAPLLPELHDYAFFFAGGDYGRAAEDYIRQFFPEHHRFQARSFEQMFSLLARDIRTRARRSRHPIVISEIVIVTHANAAGGMLIPLTNDRRRRTFTPWDLPSLQDEFRHGLHGRFRQDRREVVAALNDSTRIIVRGCNFGQSQEALDTLRIFFGGQPYIWAPKGYQGFEVLPVGKSVLRTPEEAFDFLVKQGYLPEDQLDIPVKEKREYIRKVFGADARIPAEFFVMGKTDYDALKQLPRQQKLQSAAEPFVRRPFEESDDTEQQLGVNTPSVGDYWGLSRPPTLGYDPELDKLPIEEIETRARQLNNPYRPQNAAMLLRLAAAWTRQSIKLPLVFSNDPLFGLPPDDIFGDSNLLAGDASRFPGPPSPDLFETETLPLRTPTPAEHHAAQEFRDVQEVFEAVASSGLPQSEETTVSQKGRVDTLPDGMRLWDFGVGSAQLRPAFQAAIQQMAQKAVADPASGIRVEGRTSSSGTEHGNEQLSQARAAAVQQALQAAGVAAARIVTIGFGASAPVAQERVKGRVVWENLARNRCVDVILIRPSAAPSPPTSGGMTPSTVPASPSSTIPADPSLTVPEMRVAWDAYEVSLGRTTAGPIIISSKLKLKLRGSVKYASPTTKVTFTHGQAVVDFEKKFQTSFGEMKLKGRVEPGKISQVAVGFGVNDWFDIEFAANGDLTKLYQVIFKIRPVEGEFTYEDWTFKGTIEGSLEINVGPNPEWIAEKALQSGSGQAVVRVLARAGSFARGLFIAEELGTITVVGAIGIGVAVAAVGVGTILLGLYLIGKAHENGRMLGAGYTFASGYADMLVDLTSSQRSAVYEDVPWSVERFHKLLGRDWKREFDENRKRYVEDEDRHALGELFDVGQAAVLQDWQQFMSLYSGNEWRRFAEAQRNKYGESDGTRRQAYLRHLYHQVKEEEAVGIPMTPVR